MIYLNNKRIFYPLPNSEGSLIGLTKPEVRRWGKQVIFVGEQGLQLGKEDSFVLVLELG